MRPRRMRSRSPGPATASSSRRLGLAALGLLGGLRGRRLALHALLAWLGLVGVLLGLALGEPRCVEKARHAVGRLRADAQPMLDALGVELDPVRVVLGQQRVVRADLL